MRNLKKVLTLVLTVAMLLSVMVVGTGAAFSDQDSIKNKEAVDVCTTLNIIAGMEDGSYRPANNVTRAQMCKMICVALNGGKEPTLGTNATPTFSDVRTDPSSSWAESFIESCNSQGIVSGVGGGRFSPSGSVTGTQAARMLLVALGYRADQEGFTGDAWAINVNTIASAKGLYSGIESVDANAALSRDNAAQMIWNALNAYEVEYVSQLTTVNGQLTSELVAQDKVVGSNRDKITMLEDKYEADTAIGNFAGDSNVVDGLKKGNIQITEATINGQTVGGNSPVKTFTFKYDLDLKYIGEEVKVLYRDNKDGQAGRLDEKDTIYGVYVTGATRVLNVTSNDIKNATDYDTAGKIKVDGTVYELAAPESGDTLVVTNYGAEADVTAAGADATALIASAKTAFSNLSGQNGDSVKFILNDDGKVKAAYVVKSKLGTVTAANSSKITISGLGSIEIADHEVYSDIAKNDVVVYTKLYDGDKDEAYIIVEKADSVSGNLSGFKSATASTTNSVTVDGNAYKVYNKAAMPTSVAGETGEAFIGSGHINEAFTLYLVNGYVGAAVQTSDSASNYSLVVDKSNSGTAGSALNPLKVTVLGADGQETTLTVSDKGTTPDVGDIVTYTGSTDNAKITVKGDASAAATGTSGQGYDKTSKTFNGIVTSADCVLFKCTTAGVSSTLNGSQTYKAYNIRNMKDIDVNGQAYVLVKNSDGDKVVAVFVGNGVSTSAGSSDMVIGIVSDSIGVVNVGDDPYNEYTVASNSKTYSVKIEDGASDDTLNEGDIVAFAPSSDDLYDDNTGFTVLSAANKYTDSAKTIDGTAYKVSTVLVKGYDEGDKLLTFFDDATKNGDVWEGTGTAKTLSLDKDAVVYYVDVDGDKAGDEISIDAFDAQNGYYNAIILVDDNVITHIVIETSGEDHIYN